MHFIPLGKEPIMRVFKSRRNLKIDAALAIMVLAALIAPSGGALAAASNSNRPVVEVVFVLDTTGSMSGLIAAAKEKIWSIANTLASADPAPDIRMGLVGYRDRGDTYVTTVAPLSDDLDAVYSQLMGYQADGGGDGPESVNQALHEAVTRMAWSKPSARNYRVIFLVGDAPPHMDYQNDIRYPETCRLAARRGIIINTIQCGAEPDTTPVWQKIARLSEGSFFHVSQSGSAVLYRSPFDEKIAKLSKAFDETRLYYGDAEHIAKMEGRSKMADKIYEAASPSAVAKRTIFNSKASGARNFLGGQELVQAVEDGTVDLKKIKKEHLPAKLRDMKPAELKQYVDDRIRKRKALREEISKLSKKRQDYIAAKVRQEKDAGAKSLDARIYTCLKTQAARADIDYNRGPAY
jgi:Mg-chelatase subunit ChlD